MRKDSIENKILTGIYPSKDEFIQYYIVENHSQNDTAIHFNITRPIVQSLISLWNVIKSKEQSAQLNAQAVLSGNNSVKAKIDAGVYPNQREFVEFYLTQLHGKEETAAHFNITVSVVNSLISLWNIHKTDDQIRDTKKKTCMSKFGVSSNLQSDETKQKIKETCLQKYGVSHISQAQCVKDKVRKTFMDKYGVMYALQDQDIKEKMKQTTIEKYGVMWPCQLESCQSSRHGSGSKPNQEFASKLNNLNIEYVKEYSIDGYVYDFKINDILIEIDPWISHQSTLDMRYPKKEKNYHKEKSEVAAQHGFHCVHIFDWDDQDKIIDLFLKEKEKYYARECLVKVVSQEEEIKFLNKYHLQGYVKSNICIGLYYKDRLVQLMSFNKPRYNKNYEYEILRLCSCCNVIGGANKIFKYFVETYNVTNVVSYCDLSKFNGKVYEALNFTKLRTSVGKHWYSPLIKKHITDNLLRQRGFDQILGNLYGRFGKGASNDELMLQHNFIEIYDAGQATYIYKI